MDQNQLTHKEQLNQNNPPAVNHDQFGNETRPVYSQDQNPPQAPSEKENFFDQQNLVADMDGDGEVSDEELERQKRINQLLYQREAAAVEEERSLLKWTSPARPYKERNKEYYTTIGAIVILLSIILLFAREFLLVALIISFAFVAYVLASIQPEAVIHEITTRGIRTGGKFFRWGLLGRFWFQDKFGQKLVSIETALNFPGELMLLMGDMKEDQVKDILRVYLLHETPEPKFVDKAAKWLQEKIPLESN